MVFFSSPTEHEYTHRPHGKGLELPGNRSDSADLLKALPGDSDHERIKACNPAVAFP
jgi:hypothetical protein